MSISVSVNPEIDASIPQEPKSHYDVNGNMVSYKNIPATSWSSSGVRFSVIPPSMETYMNRSLMVTYRLQIDYVGTDSGTGLLLDTGADALRSLVGLRILKTQNIALNGTSVPISSMYDTFPDIILHYQEDYRKKHPLGAVDPCTNYEDAVGGINNPLACYVDQETFDEKAQKRGAYTLVSVTRNSTTATLVYDVVEWVYYTGLFGADCGEETGLIRIRSLDLDFNIDLNAKNVMCHALNSATITSCNVSLIAQPYVLVKFISVPREILPVGDLRFPHLRLERYTTAYGSALTSNSTGTIIGNNIQLSQVPRFVWAFVREQDSSKDIYSTDTFGGIKNVSIDFNNQSALLSSASQHDLWSISHQNGLLDTIIEWDGAVTGTAFSTVGGMGGLFCAEFGRHISVGSPDLMIGSSGMFNFNIQMTVKNTNQTRTMVNPTLYVIVGYDQIMTISDGGNINFTTPNVPIAQVASGSVVKVPYNVSGLEGITQGGSARSFFKKLGTWGKEHKVLSTVGKALAPALSMTPIGPLVGPAVSTLEALGLGSGGAVITGGRVVAGTQMAGTGGASMSVSSMKNAIRQL